MEEALKSVREAHQAELDNERYYQHQNYLAMQEQIKSLEEKNKKLTLENASISYELQRKQNATQRKLNQMMLAGKLGQERREVLEEQLDESKTLLESMQAQIKSLEDEHKKLSREKASISDELQRKLNVAQRTLNQMTLAAKYMYGHDRFLECQRQLNESNNRLRISQEQIQSLEEKNKKLSIEWATEHLELNI